ncbi:Ion transport protein-domain-containing protein [Paraphysoderma sedebokerense]|nr:Ion transport protein-domain-containing protein [Paraphysoderma sedebokerense]
MSRLGSLSSNISFSLDSFDSNKQTGSTADDFDLQAALAIPQDAFHDLSSRSAVFRQRLIEDFQLLENVGADYSTRDLRDPKTLLSILRGNPDQLIKFNVFRRQNQKPKEVDRRLRRIKNKGTVPLGSWATWLVNKDIFHNTILGVIVLNSIIAAFTAEFSNDEDQHWQLFMGVKILDLVSLIIFAFEITLKWLEDFEEFWTDGWNLFDFFVTVISGIPVIIDLFIAGEHNNTVFAKSIKQLRMLRILRALKLVVRFGSLKIIVLTIIEAFRSLAIIAILIALVVYLFGVLALNLFDSYRRSDIQDLKYRADFTDLGTVFGVLFQLLTLDNWYDVANDLLKVTDPVTTWIYLILWIWLGAFIFKNIFVGVMVSNFGKLRETLKEKKAEYLKAKRFRRLRRKLDKELKMHGSLKNITDMSRKQILSTLNKQDDEGRIVSNDTVSTEETRSSNVVSDESTNQPRPHHSPIPIARSPHNLNSSDIPPVNQTLPRPSSNIQNHPMLNQLRTSLANLTESLTNLNSQPTISLTATTSQPSPNPGVPPNITLPPPYFPEEYYNTSFSHHPPHSSTSSPTHSDESPHPTTKTKTVSTAIEELLRASAGVTKGWEQTVDETLQAFGTVKGETLWPRDTLFKYFQVMESLQENMKEFEELQRLANGVLLEIFDS